MKTKRTNQWNLPYNSYNPVAEKRRDMENDAAIYKRWRKEQNQKKEEVSVEDWNAGCDAFDALHDLVGLRGM